MPNKKRGQAKVPPKDWDFFRFETFAGFSAGLLFAFILAVSGFGPLIFLVAMFCTSFSFAHIMTRAFARRRLESERGRADEAERERRALAARQAGGVAEPEPVPARRRKRKRR